MDNIEDKQEQKVYYEFVNASDEMPDKKFIGTDFNLLLAGFPAVGELVPVYGESKLYTFDIYKYGRSSKNVKWLKQVTIPNQESDGTNWKAKVEFYREQTEKLREYIHANNIGKPSQGG